MRWAIEKVINVRNWETTFHLAFCIKGLPKCTIESAGIFFPDNFYTRGQQFCCCWEFHFIWNHKFLSMLPVKTNTNIFNSTSGNQIFLKEIKVSISFANKIVCPIINDINPTKKSTRRDFSLQLPPSTETKKTPVTTPGFGAQKKKKNEFWSFFGHFLARFPPKNIAKIPSVEAFV